MICGAQPAHRLDLRGWRDPACTHRTTVVLRNSAKEFQLMRSELGNGLPNVSSTQIDRLAELDDESLTASMRWLLGSCGLGGERLWQLNGVRQENEPI